MSDTPLSVRFAEKSANLANLEAACLEFAEMVRINLAPNLSLTCGEADALARIFRLSGDADAAATLIEYHAKSDEEGDDHYTPPVTVLTVELTGKDASSPGLADHLSRLIAYMSTDSLHGEVTSIDTKDN